MPVDPRKWLNKIKMMQQFKQKYFTNNFYWVNERNYKQLQEIALDVGCLCHTGKAEIIEWHEGFKNLGFRTYEKNNNVTVFQKEPFLLHNEIATDFNEMLSAYQDISDLRKEENEIVFNKKSKKWNLKTSG